MWLKQYQQALIIVNMQGEENINMYKMSPKETFPRNDKDGMVFGGACKLMDSLYGSILTEILYIILTCLGENTANSVCL